MTGDTIEVLALAEQSLTTGLHAKGIEIEGCCGNQWSWSGTTIVSTPEMQQVAALSLLLHLPHRQWSPPAAVGGRTCVHGERIQRSVMVRRVRGLGGSARHLRELLTSVPCNGIKETRGRIPVEVAPPACHIKGMSQVGWETPPVWTVSR